MTQRAPISLLVLLTVLTVTACDRELPVEPPEEEVVAGEVVASLSCEGSVIDGLACMQEPDDVPEGMSAAIIGGQNTYVHLMQHAFTWTPSGGADDPGVLTSEVSVKNLTQQVLGSSDGTTPHLNTEGDIEGVRIFFHTGPTDGVTVQNEDGNALFTSGSPQKFYRYEQMLAPGKRSLPRTWQFELPDAGTSFSFQVYVTAAVPDESTIEEVLPGATAKLQAQSIAVGSSHSCGITLSGEAYCWGSDAAGQLGNGGIEGDKDAPYRVVGDDTWATVTAGTSHTCGLTTEGQAYCWGSNSHGQLGIGSTGGDSQIRWAVSTAHTWAVIEAGDLHTCGITTSGEAYCWGENGFGQLGLGPGVSAIPSPFYAVEDNHTWATLTAGRYHTCGITVEGDAYCWGRASDGQLGNGGGTGNQDSPSAVAGGLKWAALAAGGWHTCGITRGGESHCWGWDRYGQLGNGDGIVTSGQDSPSVVDGGGTWAALAAGWFYTCGVTVTGAAYCWGYDQDGQLGNGGTTGDQDSPSAVDDGHIWAAIAAQQTHTCGATVAGEAYCWGSDADGELGNADSVLNQTRPDPVTGGQMFARLDFEPPPCTVATRLAGDPCELGLYALAPVKELGLGFGPPSSAPDPG